MTDDALETIGVETTGAAGAAIGFLERVVGPPLLSTLAGVPVSAALALAGSALTASYAAVA
eukprot:2646192-Pleurochrysis_carterae.AAC.1